MRSVPTGFCVLRNGHNEEVMIRGLTVVGYYSFMIDVDVMGRKTKEAGTRICMNNGYSFDVREQPEYVGMAIQIAQVNDPGRSLTVAPESS